MQQERLYLLYIANRQPVRTGGRALPPLQQRMIEALQLSGLAERTQEMSSRTVRPLADHSHTSPDRSTEEARRASFLYRKNDKHYVRAARPIALCSIKFFYEHTRTRE